MDREIKKLKRRRIAPVKVRWNSKRGPEFTWEHEDQIRIKSPVLWVEIGESSLTGLELVQEMTDKFEAGNRELLKVTPWKGVVRK
ncbi:hypothetical protein Tco_0176843, partial [Tanacetum coccineum]